MNKRLLLISNSKTFGGGYLDHCAPAIKALLGQAKSVLFIPYALKDQAGYEVLAKTRFKNMGVKLSSIHHAANPAKAAREAEAIFIGGGNTFRLLNKLYKNNLVRAIKKRVEEGIPYIGTSAGANVACLTIGTTNDMPIVYPPTFAALGLVPFNINPHYLDPDPSSTHQGETREVRIKEFHEENDYPVVGLREGAWLRLDADHLWLEGKNGAKIFFPGKEPLERRKNCQLTDLLLSK